MAGATFLRIAHILECRSDTGQFTDMRYLALMLLPPLLIFGLYHLTVWFDIFGMRRRVFSRQVGVSSGLAHGLLALGGFGLLYVDYESTATMFGNDMGFAAFLMNSRDFWQFLLLFDTLAGVAMLGLLALLDYVNLGTGPIVPVTAGMVLLLGTFQWYWFGAAAGATLERIWSGLKTQDEDEPDWL
jgi:hypothetical protein